MNETAFKPGLLGPGTHLGPVHLNVTGLEPCANFYESALGLQRRSAPGPSLALHAGAGDLIVLHPVAVSQGVARRRAGLYHYCLAVERRPELGWLLRRLLDKKVELQGLVDHRMAEAIYLADPEGNGIELNWDRPRAEWRPWEEWLSMGNGPLDTESLLTEAARAAITALPKDTRIGHIHLHVADLETSLRFYTSGLGFEKTAEVPGQVIFTSAGGYHHHVAFNVWRGRGVAPAVEGQAGLEHYTVRVQDSSEIAALKVRLNSEACAFIENEKGVLVKDPSGNAALFTL